MNLRPIAFVRSPFSSKVEAPRQAVASNGTAAQIEVLADYRDALEDLETFDRIWVIFWFNQVPSGPVPSKVLPPRSDRKRGVFATRSPHRPNPIGISAVRLERIDGCVLHIRDVDFVDGTPVLDLKPYIPYADAFPEANAGWLERSDPLPTWDVTFSPQAEAQVGWLVEQHLDFNLRMRIEEALALGPQPHAYRRIKKLDDGEFVLAVKDWRARFSVTERNIKVRLILSGYRPRELANVGDPKLALHRAFVAVFG